MLRLLDLLILAVIPYFAGKPAAFFLKATRHTGATPHRQLFGNRTSPQLAINPFIATYVHVRSSGAINWTTAPPIGWYDVTYPHAASHLRLSR
jgi:hypothetical protein